MRITAFADKYRFGDDDLHVTAVIKDTIAGDETLVTRIRFEMTRKSTGTGPYSGNIIRDSDKTHMHKFVTDLATAGMVDDTAKGQLLVAVGKLSNVGPKKP